IIGAIATGILAAPSLGGTGIFDYATGKVGAYDMAAQVIIQAKTVCLTLVWSGVGAAILFGIVKALVGLRPGTDQEREGIDIVDHGERAYNYGGPAPTPRARRCWPPPSPVVAGSHGWGAFFWQPWRQRPQRARRAPQAHAGDACAPGQC